jgi:hypothetical protein
MDDAPAPKTAEHYWREYLYWTDAYRNALEKGYDGCLKAFGDFARQALDMHFTLLEYRLDLEPTEEW